MRRTVSTLALCFATSLAGVSPAAAGGGTLVANSTTTATGAYAVAPAIPVSVTMKGSTASLLDLRSNALGQIAVRSGADLVATSDFDAVSFGDVSLVGACNAGSDLQAATRTNVGTGTASLTCDRTNDAGKTVRFLVYYGGVTGQTNCVRITSRDITLADPCQAQVSALLLPAKAGSSYTRLTSAATAPFDVHVS